MSRLPTLLVAYPLFLASCTEKGTEHTLEGHWVSQSETDYHYWPSGDLSNAYKPFPIVGRMRMDITRDSIIYLDTKSVHSHRVLRRAYIRQDSMLFISGNNWKMRIQRLTTDTLTLVLQGPAYKDGRIDVGYTFTR